MCAALLLVNALEMPDESFYWVNHSSHLNRQFVPKIIEGPSNHEEQSVRAAQLQQTQRQHSTCTSISEPWQAARLSCRVYPQLPRESPCRHPAGVRERRRQGREL